MIIFSDAGNTANPALLTITEMGYLVWVTYDAESDQSRTWMAAKDGVRVEAQCTLALLGMVTLLETPNSA